MTLGDNTDEGINLLFSGLFIVRTEMRDDNGGFGSFPLLRSTQLTGVHCHNPKGQLLWEVN